MIRARNTPRASHWTKRERATLIVTAFGMLTVYLDVLILNTALPNIQREFSAGESGLQWLASTYSLGLAAFTMFAAALADRFGRKRVFMASLLLLGVGFLSAGLATTLAVMMAARGLQGIAAAGVIVTSLALVSNAFRSPGERARAIGLWTGIASLGTAVGPPLGGVLVEFLGWRSVFLLSIPVVAVLLFLSPHYLAESRERGIQSLDWWGQVLFALAIGSLTYALIQGQKAGWSSPTIISLFAVSAFGFTLFARHENTRDGPMLDVTLFRERVYSLSMATILVQFFCTYGLLLIITQYFRNIRAYPPIQAGLFTLPFVGGIVLGSPFVGRLVSRFGNRPLVLSGQVALFTGLLIVAVGMSTAPAVVLAGLLLAGLGSACLLTSIASFAMTAVPPDRAGMAAGIMNTQRAVGSTLGYAVVGTTLAVWLGTTLDSALRDTIPDSSLRGSAVEEIIGAANPHAIASGIALGPGPTHRLPTHVRDAAVAAAEGDFIQGSQLALGVSAGLLALVSASFIVGTRAQHPPSR
ncbi:MFS transporter [Streptomyces sp. ZYX-F-203]